MIFRRRTETAHLTEWDGEQSNATGSAGSGRLRGTLEATYRQQENLRTVIVHYHIFKNGTVIVHYHIFKNAGSSVNRLLRMAFGDGWASLEGPTPTSLLRPGDLATFVRDRPEIFAISSHLLRPPAPPNVRVLPVVLIRHPLDRAFSVYSYLRRHPEGVHTGTVAQRTSFSQFVLWCLNNKTLGGMVITNYQVIHLSPASFRNGHIFHAIATKNDLQHAIDYLSDAACLGTVDLFDAAMGRLGRAAAAIDLHLPTSTVIENATPDRPRDLGERLYAVERQLGSDLYRRYIEENELDYRLYEWASSRDYQDSKSFASSVGSPR